MLSTVMKMLEAEKKAKGIGYTSSNFTALYRLAIPRIVTRD